MSATLVLPARLDSAAALSLARDLKARIGTDIELDARDVSMFGALAVQALAVAADAWHGTGRRLVLVNLASEAAAQLSDLGAEDLVPRIGDDP